MRFTEYSVGIGYLIVISGAFGFAAVEFRRHLVPHWTGALARLGELLLAISVLVVISELLGSFGVLTRAGLFLSALVTAALARATQPYLSGHRAIDRPTSTDKEGSDSTEPQILKPPRWAVLLSFAVAGVAILHWSGGVQGSLDFGIYRQDSTWYHLPVAAGFFQTGNTWSLQFTDPMALTAWFYPMNSELLHTAGMLAFQDDFLSPFLNLFWLALAMLAAWCIGRPFGLAPLTFMAAALVFNSEMMQAQAGNAPSDIAGTFFLLAMAAVLLSADAEAGAKNVGLSTGPLILASLAGGLAIGTKITLLVPVALITVGVVVLAGPGRRMRTGTIWAGGILLTGGYWYVRNLLHAGNPLPWISTGPLTSPDQLHLYPRPPHSVASYATDFHIWLHEFVPALTRTLGPLWPLLLAGAVTGLVLALVRPQPMRRLLAAGGIAAWIAYVFIPVSASGSPGHPSGFESNLRYLAPALALGLTLFVLESANGVRRQKAVAIGVAAIYAIGAITSSGWGFSQVPLGAVLIFLMIAPVAMAYMWRSGSPATGLVAVGASALVLVVVAGYSAQRSYSHSRYIPSLAPPADNPGFRATPQWRRIQAWARREHDVRIGIVGPPAAFGQYVFYGSDLSNRVGYLGEQGPHGSYRPIEDCMTWRQAVNDGEYRYVIVTPASAVGPGPLPQESLWMIGSPTAHPILRAGPAAVYRIDGRLKPRGCATSHLPPVVRVPGGGFTVPGLRPPSLPPARQ